jgi:hypothetical protein
MAEKRGVRLSRRVVVAGLCASGAYAATRTVQALQPGASPPLGIGQQRALALKTGGIDAWTRMRGSEFSALGFRLKFLGTRPLISEGERPPEVARRSAFLAVFEIVGGGQMPGDLIYTLATRGVAPFDVFLSSAASARFPNRMHAVFN